MLSRILTILVHGGFYMDDRFVLIGDRIYERMSVSINALLEGQAKGLFEQLCTYMDYIGLPSSEASILTTALKLTFYVSILDPVIKHELIDYLSEIRLVLDFGKMEDLQQETDFIKRVAPYVRRNRKVSEFNSYALREIVMFLSYDRGGSIRLVMKP